MTFIWHAQTHSEHFGFILGYTNVACDKMMYGTNLQVIGAETATPFLDDMSLVKNQIDKVVHK